MALHAGFTGSSGNVIYFGTNRLYRSADQGLTWTGLGSSGDGFGMDLTRGSPPDVSGFSFAVISSITAHTSLDNGSSPAGETVWVGTGDGLVQVTTSAGALGGARFVDTTKGPLPGRFVTDIAIDPSDPRRAIVAYSGFNANTPGRPGHIFETSDLGGSWADISGNLPDIPVTSIVVDPLLEGTIYAGTDLGVFQSSDRGATWVRLGEGMPRVAVFMLRYHAASRSLVAATHGRGIFRLALPGAVVSVSAASYRRTDLAIEGIAAAFGTNLATATVPAETTPLPTELGGTRISIRDSRGASRPAPLLLVSPTQINYEVPPETAPGPVSITVTSGDGTVSLGTERVNLVAPAVFSANASGRDVAAAYAVRVRDDVQTVIPVSEYSPELARFVSTAMDLGPPGDVVVLVLFGTGIRYRSGLSAVGCQIGGETAEVQYASLVSAYVGLDQINVVVPRILAGRGEQDVRLTVEGRAANTVTVKIK